MHIFVNISPGKIERFEVEKSTTMFDLKEMIFQSTRVNATVFKYYYRLITSCNKDVNMQYLRIRKGDTIHVVF